MGWAISLTERGLVREAFLKSLQAMLLANKSPNIGKTTMTNQCKTCRIFGDLDQLKSKDTLQKTVD